MYFCEKRTISTILVALLILSAFAGCNGKSEAQLELEKTQSELSESQKNYEKATDDLASSLKGAYDQMGKFQEGIDNVGNSETNSQSSTSKSGYSYKPYTDESKLIFSSNDEFEKYLKTNNKNVDGKTATVTGTVDTMFKVTEKNYLTLKTDEPSADTQVMFEIDDADAATIKEGDVITIYGEIDNSSVYDETSDSVYVFFIENCLILY